MIVHDAEQGTQEWLEARLGIPTGSSFKNIITKTGKKSSMAKDYRMQLLADWLAGRYLDEEHFQSFAMLRGYNLQPQALDWYKLQRDVDVSEVGLCFKDATRMVAVSPDGLVGDDGMVEVKCPFAKGQARTLLSGEMDQQYKPQVMGQLWVCDRQWADYVSYHPEMPSLVVRVHRDEEYIGWLRDALTEFVHMMLEERNTLAKKGFAGALEAHATGGDDDGQEGVDGEVPGGDEGDPAAGEDRSDHPSGGSPEGRIRQAALSYQERTDRSAGGGGKRR